MSTPATSSPGGFGKALLFTWAALLSALVAFDHFAIKQAQSEAEDKADRDALSATQDELGAVRSKVEALADLKPASQSSLASAQQNIARRLDSLERGLATQTQQADMKALQDRLRVLEKQSSKALRLSATKTADAPRPPETSLPPFTVIGMELRGGERFLAIAPAGITALGEVRVLRPGESQGNWRLDNLDGHRAQFTVDGVARSITVP